jgi:hypothetical protein
MNAKRLYIPVGLSLFLALTAGLALAQGPRTQAPLGSSFTYQGRLTDTEGRPINDTCDFRFSLWDDATSGSQTGSTLDLADTDLQGGLFTLQLDFGSVFDGTALWLRVEVKCSGDDAYATLDPRQPLTAAPYTLHAVDAELLDGQAGSYYRDASNVNAGTLSPARYSAYADLGDEGYLDAGADADLLTRAQADGRFVNEGQGDSVTSAMIVDGTVAAGDLEDGAALAEILDDDGPASGLDADTVDGLQSSSLARVGRFSIPGGGGSVAISFPHYNAFQVTIGEAFASPSKVAWMAGIENDGDLAWLAIDSTGAVSTGTCDLGTSTATILTLGANITLKCPGNSNLELTLTSTSEDVRAFLVW